MGFIPRQLNLPALAGKSLSVITLILLLCTILRKFVL
jgi:hypothetical protein